MTSVFLNFEPNFTLVNIIITSLGTACSVREKYFFLNVARDFAGRTAPCLSKAILYPSDWFHY